MGRVRFYSADGSIYITVREDEVNPYSKFTYSLKVRKVRKMPYVQKQARKNKPLSASETAAGDPYAYEKIIAALSDIQAGIEEGTYESVILGTVFKSDELQMAVRLGKSKYKNLECDNFVEALLNYCDDLGLYDVPNPPTPLKKGDGK